MPGHLRLTNPFVGGTEPSTETGPKKRDTSRDYQSLPQENIPGVSVSDPRELPEHLQMVFANKLGL